MTPLQAHSDFFIRRSIPVPTNFISIFILEWILKGKHHTLDTLYDTTHEDGMSVDRTEGWLSLMVEENTCAHCGVGSSQGLRGAGLWRGCESLSIPTARVFFLNEEGHIHKLLHSNLSVCVYDTLSPKKIIFEVA